MNPIEKIGARHSFSLRTAQNRETGRSDKRNGEKVEKTRENRFALSWLVHRNAAFHISMESPPFLLDRIMIRWNKTAASSWPRLAECSQLTETPARPSERTVHSPMTVCRRGAFNRPPWSGETRRGRPWSFLAPLKILQIRRHASLVSVSLG